MNNTLYAWMRPISVTDHISVKWLDHTYVTSYSQLQQYPTINDVINAGEDFWYCWGALDYKGSKLVPNSPLGGAAGNILQSRCICKSNDSNAHGTIYKYLRDGVCHQLANQVLYTTSPRITVEGAKGWKLSFYWYGPYGTQHAAWIAQIQHCTAGGVPMISDNSYVAKIGAIYKSAPKDASPEDIRSAELRVHVEHCLGYALSGEIMDFLANKKEEALNQREALYSKAESGKITPSEFAQQVNQIHNTILDEIATKLSPEEFEKVFGFPSDDKIQLIDPESAKQLFKTMPNPM